MNGRTCILHLCCHWAKRIYHSNIANTLEHYGAMPYTIIISATASDPAALQFYAPFAGCCDRGIFQGYRPFRINHLR